MPVQPLTVQDGVANAIRRVGQKRLHIFTACKHTVEDNHCMYPPEHTERAIRQNPRTETIVRFRGLCSTCEERALIPNAIVEETKKVVTRHLHGIIDSSAGPLTEGPVKWAKDRLVVEFKYKKTKQIETDADEWDVCPVVVWPSVEDPSSDLGARQWEDVSKLNSFEHKWNEVVPGSRVARNRSSDADITQAFPPFPELLPQGARVLEDHYRYDDPDLFEILPYATPEDFNHGM
ncbi:hypothetical protein TSTA_117570 [Talaromyces stipitatus ATCC 10500]|uniref:Uncharacterized protein n=1 Tax=Talaromyces stipitatus (strain ATCC 10500 / CBS 375.48 / QM 6759 / NRRL 1006) TaxID=441959 RepID=B8MDL7_TALSN|nr:uncharacterized protein TSTA_117570 [Talaromyces stipitatus ATCC 10500]EED17980.1 hypothetical protein TSTA_117570 [Talaromyces stipitatus ATCC 10500]